jgi:hypothetical protein
VASPWTVESHRHLWTCPSLRLHELQTKWAVHSQVAEQAGTVRSILCECKEFAAVEKRQFCVRIGKRICETLGLWRIRCEETEYFEWHKRFKEIQGNLLAVHDRVCILRSEVILPYGFIEELLMVTYQCCSGELKSLWESIRTKRPEIWIHKWILQYENTPPPLQDALKLRDFLAKKSVTK